MKRKGLFITGTDTDVGKTYISAQIIRKLNAFAAPIKVRKPIESGCQRLSDGSLHPADGFELWQANDQQETLQQVTAFRFSPAIAPNRAAALAHTQVTTEQLQHACLDNIQQHDFLLVEGAGGFYSPLSTDGLNADLAKLLNLNIILVVKDQLGCINHTLLTLQAIQHTSLQCIAIILNQSSENSINTYDHSNELASRCSPPVFQCFNDKRIKNSDTLLNIITQAC